MDVLKGFLVTGLVVVVVGITTSDPWTIGYGMGVAWTAIGTLLFNRIFPRRA
jgi:hypothetical protein